MGGGPRRNLSRRRIFGANRWKPAARDRHAGTDFGFAGRIRVAGIAVGDGPAALGGDQTETRPQPRPLSAVRHRSLPAQHRSRLCHHVGEVSTRRITEQLCRSGMTFDAGFRGQAQGSRPSAKVRLTPMTLRKASRTHTVRLLFISAEWRIDCRCGASYAARISEEANVSICNTTMAERPRERLL